MPRRRPAWIPALLLLLGGCSLLGDDPGESAAPPSPVTPAAVTSPDRDRDVVSRRLAALDPCVLAQAGAPEGATTRATSPTVCTLRLPTTHANVRVEIGAGLSQQTRFHRSRQALGGAVAYAESPVLETCGWYLPVDQGRAIHVWTYDDGCAATRRVARGVAELLMATPERALADPSPALVPPCEWLRAGHGEPTGDEVVVDYLFGPSAAPGECSVRRPSGGIPVDTLVLGVALDHGHRQYLVEPGRGARAVAVAGRPAALTTSAGDCDLQVAAAPLTVGPSAHDDVLRLRVVAQTCPEARRAATRMLEAVDAREPAAPDFSDPPLLYPADGPDPAEATSARADSDVAAVGACAHVSDATERECAPATGAEVPEDPADLLLAAQADAEVLCAALLPQVREHFGDDVVAGTGVLSRATAAQQVAGEDAPQEPACYFGEPEHALHLTATASWRSLDESTVGEAEQEVAGHTAVTTSSTDPESPSRSWTVALGDPAEPGVLSLHVQVTQDRSQGLWQGVPVDGSLMEPAEAFVEDAVRDLLDRRPGGQR
ncbi:hypothetical protein [Nocardioides solisilvae]|uniref:hypothetical protein n=1 Tax=Nocardioides solisilvae TaxID=1542435 RepID=UPI0013A530A9|nr:hypothetical protein [Nocardioides solisilvae]